MWGTISKTMVKSRLDMQEISGKGTNRQQKLKLEGKIFNVFKHTINASDLSIYISATWGKIKQNKKSYFFLFFSLVFHHVLLKIPSEMFSTCISDQQIRNSGFRAECCVFTTPSWDSISKQLTRIRMTLMN